LLFFQCAHAAFLVAHLAYVTCVGVASALTSIFSQNADLP
jgi:hypothetical protein